MQYIHICEKCGAQWSGAHVCTITIQSPVKLPDVFTIDQIRIIELTTEVKKMRNEIKFLLEEIEKLKNSKLNK